MRRKTQEHFVSWLGISFQLSHRSKVPISRFFQPRTIKQSKSQTVVTQNSPLWFIIDRTVQQVRLPKSWASFLLQFSVYSKPFLSSSWYVGILRGKLYVIFGVCVVNRGDGHHKREKKRWCFILSEAILTGQLGLTGRCCTGPTRAEIKKAPKVHSLW